jgi:hypothetical protein
MRCRLRDHSSRQKRAALSFYIFSKSLVPEGLVNGNENNLKHHCPFSILNSLNYLIFISLLKVKTACYLPFYPADLFPMKQAYFRTCLIALISFAPFLALAQGFGLPAGFELKKFEANQLQAMYFLEYDSAWQRVASSFAMTTANKDVICYEDKKGWKVVAGTVDSSGFKEAAYYTVDAKNVVTLSKKKFDTVQVASMGRALYNANKALAKLNIKVGSWKKFSKVNLNQSITIWAFPDTDAAGNILYGPECAWYYSPNGSALMTSIIVNKAPIIAGKTGSVLTLSCPTEKMPTIGAIWLSHRWKLTYNEINVSYKTGTSTLHYNVAEKTYAWDHTAN